MAGGTRPTCCASLGDPDRFARGPRLEVDYPLLADPPLAGVALDLDAELEQELGGVTRHRETMLDRCRQEPEHDARRSTADEGAAVTAAISVASYRTSVVDQRRHPLNNPPFPEHDRHIQLFPKPIQFQPKVPHHRTMEDAFRIEWHQDEAAAPAPAVELRPPTGRID